MSFQDLGVRVKILASRAWGCRVRLGLWNLWFLLSVKSSSLCFYNGM